MEYTIQNDNIKVSGTTMGGTLCSIKDKDAIEYLWQGDKAYWSGQAPVLFPICGSIRNDKARTKSGENIELPRHGLVRKKEFQFVHKSDDCLEFMIESTTEMEKAYPFSFQLFTKYELLEKGVKITYTIKNTGQKTMPYFIGGHPGFNCPLEKDEKYEDYHVIFEQMECCTIPTPITETGLIDMEHRVPFFNNHNCLKLQHELFKKDAIILDNIKSRVVKLESEKSGKGITLFFRDFPNLILWSSANCGNFIALEPWMGLSTCNDEGDVFEQKRNVQYVEAEETRSYSYEISLL